MNLDVKGGGWRRVVPGQLGLRRRKETTVCANASQNIHIMGLNLGPKVGRHKPSLLVQGLIYLPMPFFIHRRFSGVPVLATQWFPGREVAGVAGERPGHPGGNGLLPSPPHAYLITPKGRFTLFAGDWVITEPEGRVHVCQNTLFQQSYLPVKEKHAPARSRPRSLRT